MFINCEIMERKERGKRVQMIQRERDGVFFVGKKHTAEGFLFYVCATASTWNPSEFFFTGEISSRKWNKQEDRKRLSSSNVNTSLNGYLRDLYHSFCYTCGHDKL